MLVYMDTQHHNNSVSNVENFAFVDFSVIITAFVLSQMSKLCGGKKKFFLEQRLK